MSAKKRRGCRVLSCSVRREDPLAQTMKSRCQLLLAALTLSAVACALGDWPQCASPDGTIVNFHVDGCKQPDTCVLKKGTLANVTIAFNSKVASKGVNVKVHGVIHEVPLPFPLPQPDACQSGVACPIKPQGSYTYRGSFPVKSSYPSISLNIRWELVDDHGNDLVCQLIPVSISS
ncbi:NPC intracellular cholesterol transporter 2-like [Dermacentor andersoni]|uniref:NPC intracellular cholesterol transporter 2-like n=1 Tax=Dermacentor andersoni TaxID=34620 RepID=UPI002155915F|nr:NPC intracellular cholesterol transporter 2-like [Dermacentor andersoni]